MIWLFFLFWALLLLLRLRHGRADSRAAMQLAGAALLLAAAGYAWQGHPGLRARPVQTGGNQAISRSAFADIRPEFFPRFDAASHWVVLADSYQRRGDTQNAVGVLQSALRAHPRDTVLWVALGDALQSHSNGLMSPAAELAYRRAAVLAPGHPGPRFFYGLGLIRAGEMEAGASVWRNLLADSPMDAKWRSAVADRLAIIEKLQAPSREKQ